MSNSPHIYHVKQHRGIAGQFSVTARVGYQGEAPREVTFTGSSYGGPVVMSSNGQEVFVTDPGRFGEFSKGWVRRFFA
jgi:hypothetical protein